MTSSRVIEAIAVTAELCGRTFSPAAAMMFASDLDGFPESAVLLALTRCRKEVRGMMTIQDVISRIDDGRPGVEQAWAMIPQDENTSVVWTDEMAAAWGTAASLLREGDRIGARMAFKETYAKLVSDARDQKEPPKWTPSFGDDRYGRQAAMAEAVRMNRLTLDHAVLVLGDELGEGLIRTLGVTKHPLLAPPSAEGKERMKALMLTLKAIVT
jgi:hypothetical protein